MWHSLLSRPTTRPTSLSSMDMPPTVKELRLASAEFVNSAGHPSKALLPNIVFFHAESTFDPNIAFRLSARVELPLWSKQSETRALGPLRVNVIGGGSWVTEFEVITGVDSRIFGYEGFYTHYYIAPKVKNSFAIYLARKGYRAAVFYPTEGSFYNVEKAFRSYGVKDFNDGGALGLPADWGSLIDRDIIKTVIARGAFKGSDPFFYSIVTSQNHGPHPCWSFANEQQFLTKFAAQVSFEENCQFNEYLKRAVSTSDAFELVLKQLRQIEKTDRQAFRLTGLWRSSTVVLHRRCLFRSRRDRRRAGLQEFLRCPNQFRWVSHILSLVGVRQNGCPESIHKATSSVASSHPRERVRSNFL